MKICAVCSTTIKEGEAPFVYFSDEGRRLEVCGSCFLALKRRDYKSGEHTEDGSSG